jgi:hypothetical protein
MGYVSGASLGTSTATWTGATITSLGLAPGAYMWSWGSGATADTFTLDIAAGRIAVPELATWAMMLLGFAGLGFMQARRRIPAPGERAGFGAVARRAMYGRASIELLRARMLPLQSNEHEN